MSFLSTFYFLNCQHFIQICTPKSFCWKLFASERKNREAGGWKTEFTLFFFHNISHIFNVFLFSFSFSQVFVTHCVPDLKLDRLSGMYSIWHVKFLLLLPTIHGSKCRLYFLNICNKFQPRSQLMGICFGVGFFLPFFRLSSNAKRPI